MLQFEPAVAGLVAETGGHYVALQFVVQVVGQAAAETQAGKAGQGFEVFAAYIPAFAAQVDAGHPVCFIVVAMSAMAAAMQVRAMQMAVFEIMAVAGQAIDVVLCRIGQADITAVADPGQTETASAGARVTAGDPLAFLPAVADAVIVAVTVQPFGVQGEIAAAGRDGESAGAFAGGRGAEHFDMAGVTCRRNLRGNLVIKAVDDAPAGATAIGQTGRAAQDLDLVAEQRLDRHCVILADGRSIHHFRTVAEDAHPRPVHAANDGATGAGAEMTGVSAGLVRQRFAQCGCSLSKQVIGGENGDGRCHVIHTQGQAARLDGNRW